tara:strand:- start:20 stop:547 length:528 start_codon:yes stop_codon:yes gene_type:complete
MSNYSSGKFSKFISDRSGMQFPYKERITEWNGSVVHISEYEAKQPQLNPVQTISEPEALWQPRIDRTEPQVARLLPFDAFKTGAGGQATTVVTVNEIGHGRTAGSKVRFRNVFPFDGISATVMQSATGYDVSLITLSDGTTDSDNYRVTVSATATNGSTKGGGPGATAGPVTLEK